LSGGLEGGFYAGVYFGMGELGGYADAVHDGLFVGGAVAYDADSADAEEGGAAVLGVVEALFELGDGLAGEECAHLRGDGGLEGLAEGYAEEFGGAFKGLEGDVADEAVAYGDVGVAVEKVAAFDVADEVDVGDGAEEGEAVAGEGVALGVLFADGEEADAWVGDLEDVFGVHLAHDGELDEVVWVAVDVGANVEEQGRDAVDGRQDGGEGGAIDAGEHAQDHLCSSHGGAGVAGGEEAGGAAGAGGVAVGGVMSVGAGEALADHLEADAHGGVALGADGLGGLVVHGDPLGCWDDEDWEMLAAEMLAEDRAQDVLGASEVDPDVELTCSENGPANLWLGGLVGTHRVNDNVDRHQEKITGLC